VQLRDKQLDARSVLSRATIVRDVCQDHGVPFILNDRPDLALECGADGVHVGQDDAPPALARRLLGPDAVIGFSTHSALDLTGAERVNYELLGNVEPALHAHVIPRYENDPLKLPWIPRGSDSADIAALAERIRIDG